MFISYANFLGAWKTAMHSGRVHFDVPRSNQLLDLLSLLERQGLIINFSLLTSKWVRVYTAIHGDKAFVNSLVFFSRPSFHKTVSFKKLIVLRRTKKGFYGILSTRFGLLTIDEAIERRVGGELLITALGYI